MLLLLATYRLAVIVFVTISILFGSVSGGGCRGCSRHFTTTTTTRVLPVTTRRGRTIAAGRVAFLTGRNDSSSSSITISWQQQQQRHLCSSMAAKLDSPSAERNKDPIWKVLETQVFPRLLALQKNDHDSEQQQRKPLQVLEIAAGAGVHMQYFAQQLLNKNKDGPLQQQEQFGAFQWQSTDPDPQCLDSLLARRNELLLSSSSSSSPATAGVAAAAYDASTSSTVQEPLSLTLDANGICESSTAEKLRQQNYDLIMNINMIHISPWEATLGLFKLAGEQQHGGILFLYGPYKVNGTCVESNRYVYLLKTNSYRLTCPA
jgi:Protein of unknown function (DUF938)